MRSFVGFFVSSIEDPELILEQNALVLKDTALVSLAGLNDLVAHAKTAAGATKEPFIFFIVAALFFIVFSAATAALAAMYPPSAKLSSATPLCFISELKSLSAGELEVYGRNSEPAMVPSADEPIFDATLLENPEVANAHWIPWLSSPCDPAAPIIAMYPGSVSMIMTALHPLLRTFASTGPGSPPGSIGMTAASFWPEAFSHSATAAL